MDKNDFSYNGEKIILDKERTVRLTIPGMKFLSKHYGTIDNAFKKFETAKWNAEFFDDLTIWTTACLLHEDDKINIKKVENMIEFNNFTKLFIAITKCIKGSMPESNMPESNEVATENQGESQSTSIE